MHWLVLVIDTFLNQSTQHFSDLKCLTDWLPFSNHLSNQTYTYLNTNVFTPTITSLVTGTVSMHCHVSRLIYSTLFQILKCTCIMFMFGMPFHMYCYGDKHVHSHQIILLIYQVFRKTLESSLDLHRDNV